MIGAVLALLLSLLLSAPALAASCCTYLPTPVPGCDDATCQSCVCVFDPDCCLAIPTGSGWDYQCSQEALGLYTVLGTCDPPCACAGIPSPTPTQTVPAMTVTPGCKTITPTGVMSPSATPTRTPTPSVTPSITATVITPTPVYEAQLQSFRFLTPGICVMFTPAGTVTPSVTLTPTITKTPTVTATATISPTPLCPYTFLDDTGDMGRTCAYSGGYNLTCDPPVNAVFVGDGRHLSVVFSTQPTLKLKGTATFARTASMTHYSIGTGPDRPLPKPIAVTLDIPSTHLETGAIPVSLCALVNGCDPRSLCPMAFFLGSFQSQVSPAVPPPSSFLAPVVE